MCTTFPVQFAIYLHLSVFQKAQIVFALTAHAVLIPFEKHSSK